MKKPAPFLYENINLIWLFTGKHDLKMYTLDFSSGLFV